MTQVDGVLARMLFPVQRRSSSTAVDLEMHTLPDSTPPRPDTHNQILIKHPDPDSNNRGSN
ncbi:hypothetical protein LZ30DRAFT_698894 [Colletotrichum cereale]|nr:hypothetical protein LZ30DRAFT_698894 [Colletotrichum cereale]